MAENYKHLYGQMKHMVEKYQDEILPGMRKQLEETEAKLKAYQDTVLTPEQVQLMRWIPVEEQLPPVETKVWVRYETAAANSDCTVGMYEDGKQDTENSSWVWYEHDFPYCEEIDAYIIPAGWWEYCSFKDGDDYNHPIDCKVTHWMPMPEVEK